MKPTFFRKPADFRQWLRKNHATAQELWVGFYKVGSGKPSLTWPESVDEALCVGWIDGVRKTIDEQSYRIRFTPRKKVSTWSAVNVRRVKVLTDEKRIQPAGLKAFEARRESRSGIYAYEQRPKEFDEPYLGLMTKDKAAWTYFQSQSPSYRRTLIWYVVSAKQEETRLERLKRLIEACAGGRRLA